MLLLILFGFLLWVFASLLVWSLLYSHAERRREAPPKT